MAKEKKPNPIYTVKWLMKDKGIIKFVELPDDTYEISKEVLKYDLEKYGVKNEARVEVGLEGNTVTFLKVAKEESKPAETKKEEPKQEKAPEEKPKETEQDKKLTADKVYEWTISGIPVNKEVIAFKEGTSKWYQVPESIRSLDFNALGIKAKARVQVTLGEIEIKGEKKPSITTIEVIKESAEEQKEKETPKATDYSQSTKDSIERQTAFKAACMAANERTDEQIISLAEKGLKFIQGR